MVQLRKCECGSYPTMIISQGLKQGHFCYISTIQCSKCLEAMVIGFPSWTFKDTLVQPALRWNDRKPIPESDIGYFLSKK